MRLQVKQVIATPEMSIKTCNDAKISQQTEPFWFHSGFWLIFQYSLELKHVSMGSRHTCTLVPALAGSTPSLARPKGSIVPVRTEVMTIRNRDRDMAQEFTKLPSVMYTRMKPPAATTTKVIRKG